MRSAYYLTIKKFINTKSRIIARQFFIDLLKLGKKDALANLNGKINNNNLLKSPLSNEEVDDLKTSLKHLNNRFPNLVDEADWNPLISKANHNDSQKPSTIEDQDTDIELGSNSSNYQLSLFTTRQEKSKINTIRYRLDEHWVKLKVITNENGQKILDLANSNVLEQLKGNRKAYDIYEIFKDADRNSNKWFNPLKNIDQIIFGEEDLNILVSANPSAGEYPYGIIPKSPVRLVNSKNIKELGFVALPDIPPKISENMTLWRGGQLKKNGQLDMTATQLVVDSLKDYHKITNFASIFSEISHENLSAKYGVKSIKLNKEDLKHLAKESCELSINFTSILDTDFEDKILAIPIISEEEESPQEAILVKGTLSPDGLLDLSENSLFLSKKYGAETYRAREFIKGFVYLLKNQKDINSSITKFKFNQKDIKTLATATKYILDKEDQEFLINRVINEDFMLEGNSK